MRLSQVRAEEPVRRLRQRAAACLYAAEVFLLSASISACNSNASFSASVVAPGASSNGHTIGLVLANFDWMMPDEKAECPDGAVHTNRENWEAQFPTQAARQAHLNRCGDVRNRGPNCENVWLNPTAIEDALPFREPKSKAAYGINLDGTHDGATTGSTCAHEKFIDPAGELGIDNQYYRFLGCHIPLLSGIDEERRRRLLSLIPLYRLLLEIKGATGARGDNAVEVNVYRSKDPLIVDVAGKAVPWQSQRVAGPPIYRLRGRIIDGVLRTAPEDVMWDGELTVVDRRVLIRGMTLRLALTPTGAEGVRAGYLDVEQLWQSYSHMMTYFGGLIGASGPAAYAELHRLADGYKDPQTGACTALSSARKYEFVRAYVVHPAQETAP
jgi:hypothetical protein